MGWGAALSPAVSGLHPQPNRPRSEIGNGTRELAGVSRDPTLSMCIKSPCRNLAVIRPTMASSIPILSPVQEMFVVPLLTRM